MKILLFIILCYNNILLSQCNGCNENFQPINLWSINKKCDKTIRNYTYCNSQSYFMHFIPNTSEKKYESFGSQIWKNNKLLYLHFHDSRYTINEKSLNSLGKVTTLLLDGVNIENNSDSLLVFESEYLLFRQNNFSNPINKLKFSEKLKHLSLDENDLFGQIPDWFTTYPNLINLSIEYNKISGSIPSNINNLYELKSLTLNNNELTGVVPESICELSYLKILHLQYNKLETLPDCICELKKRGVEIELYGNKFCEDVPKCIENEIGFQECF